MDFIVSHRERERKGVIFSRISYTYIVNKEQMINSILVAYQMLW